MLPSLYMYLFPQCELVLQNHQTSITSWASDNTPGCLHHRKRDKLPLDGPISLSADLRPYKPSGLFLLEHILVSFTWYQQKNNQSFCKEYWPITSYTPYQFLKFCWEFCFNSCENEEIDPSDGYLSQLQFWNIISKCTFAKNSALDNSTLRSSTSCWYICWGRKTVSIHSYDIFFQDCQQNLIYHYRHAQKY